MFRVTDCIAGGIRCAIQKPTEWQDIGNQINAAMILAWADLINVL